MRSSERDEIRVKMCGSSLWEMLGYWSESDVSRMSPRAERKVERINGCELSMA